MKQLKILLYMMFVFFVCLNLYAIFSVGFSAFSELFNVDNPWLLVGFIDLLIVLGLSCIWMYLDARNKGKSAIGYILLTCVAGSIGILLYLIREPETYT